MIVDTNVLLAYFDRNERAHGDVTALIEGTNDSRIISPYVVAEIDYLVATRFGVRAELEALGELASGAWQLVDFGPDDIRRAAAIIDKYADQNVGLADASMVVLADRYRTRTIATLDRRHFGVMRPSGGGRFRLVP